MASKTTNELKKKRNIFAIISSIIWVGTALASVIAVLCSFNKTDSSGMPIFSEEFKALLVSVGVTICIGIVIAIFIKNKMRTFVWMVSLVLNSIAFKEVGMYITLALWLIDEYVFLNLYHHYKKRVDINKEIDLRMEK